VPGFLSRAPGLGHRVGGQRRNCRFGALLAPKHRDVAYSLQHEGNGNEFKQSTFVAARICQHEGYIDSSAMPVGGGADNVVVPNQKVAQNVLIDGAFDPQSRIQNMCLTYQARASRRESRRMLAIRTHASALAMDAS